MRVACLDETAAKRVELQKAIDEAYDKCRDSIGHLSPAQTYPASIQELLVNTAPEIVLVGPGFSVEAAYSAAREVHEAHPRVPICVMLRSEHYSLRALRRFEKVTNDVFSVDDPPIRIVHKLTSLAVASSHGERGKLVTVEGVKGGVGATSLTSGLAHAAQAIGKSAVVLDLSSQGALTYYMAPERNQSADLSAALVDQLFPDSSLVERCLSTAPNGIVLFLPPSGGSEIRELWLRDSSRFEIMLSIVNLLSERFDLIIADIAATEGVLPFALACRAQTRVLVSSNDPASVHLLSNALSSLVEAPGEGEVQILLNNTSEGGLSGEDVLDFLYCNRHFEQTMTAFSPIPYDAAGGSWIGTGNTFYTESSSKVQRVLEETAAMLALRPGEVLPRKVRQTGILEKFKRFTSRPKLIKSTHRERLALPLIETKTEPQSAGPLLRPKTGAAKPQESPSDVELQEVVYQPPKLAINE